MKAIVVVFASAFVVTFAVLGAYDCGRKTAPVIQDAAVRIHRELTQQDEIERLKAELEAERQARHEETTQLNLDRIELHQQIKDLEARPPQVVYDAPELAL